MYVAAAVVVVSVVGEGRAILKVKTYVIILSVRMSGRVCLSVCLSLCLSVCLPACLIVCLSVYWKEWRRQGQNQKGGGHKNTK